MHPDAAIADGPIADDLGSIHDLLAQDRNLAFAGVELLAQTLAHDEMELWELSFLHGVAASVTGRGPLVRAMELYAHLKVTQAAHCEPFPGYVGDAGPIAAVGPARR